MSRSQGRREETQSGISPSLVNSIRREPLLSLSVSVLRAVASTSQAVSNSASRFTTKRQNVLVESPNGQLNILSVKFDAN